MGARDLQPCPFCGSQVLNQFRDDDFHVIQCAQCGCEIKHTQHHKITAAWNRRAPSAEAAERLAGVRVKGVEAAREALGELANVKMDLALDEWCRISNTILAALAEPDGEAEPCQFLPTEDGEFNGNTFSDDPVPFGWITQSAYDRVNNSSLPEKVTIIRNAVGPTDMPRVPLYTTPPDASAIRGCATEGCSNRATVHFERGEVGSDYCHSCYMRVQALAGAKP